MLGLSCSFNLDCGSCIVSIAEIASKEVGALICFFLLAVLNKHQKQVCRTACPPLAASPESLTRHQELTSLRWFCRYYFGRYLPELDELAPTLYSRWRFFRYSHRLQIFLSPFLDVLISISTAFFAWLDSLIICPQNSFF